MDKKTKAIHGVLKNEKKYKFNQGIGSPINTTSSFYFQNIKESKETFKGENKGYVYSRGRNPSLEEFEEKMALLEGGSFAVSFGSGMGSIATLLLSLLEKGDYLIAGSILYGSSYNLIKNILPGYGINTILVDLNKLEAEEIKKFIGEEIEEEGKKLVVYFETPINPTLETIDIADIRKKFGDEATIVVDNTFATPILQNPLKEGADFVIHSCSKYIGGHGDAIGGVVVGLDSGFEAELRYGYMCELGSVMSPFNAWLFIRGLKTLPLRMAEHQKNAKAIVAYLADEAKVTKVYYPGFGGLVSFTIEGDEAKFVEALELFTLGVSLGDVESLVELPFKMTHRNYKKKEIADLMIEENLIRLSVGLEAQEDLIADLKEAFKKCQEP